MAKLTGILPLSGQLDGISFYKLGDVIVARRTWRPSKKSIKRDPKYQHFRENGKEFGNCVKAGAVLRRAIRVFTAGTAYKRMSPRMNQMMAQMKKLDRFSKRGKRTAGNGLMTHEGKALLCTFAFNAEHPLEKVLLVTPQTDFKTGTITLKSLLSKRDLKFPKGATHARLRSGLVFLDHEILTHQLSQAPEVMVSKKAAARTVTLTAPLLPFTEGFQLLVLSIDFFQEVKGEIFSMEDGAGCCCGVVGVR